MFTGSTNDWDGNEPLVYAVGRNDDSGTRLAAFADTLFGIFTAPDQFDITGTNASTIAIAQDTQVDGTGNPAQPGTQGYSSGGKVATAMKVPGSATAAQDPIYGSGTGWYAISYPGLADGATVVSGGGAYLTYNGVAYSPANVQNGSYALWGYEHILGIQGLSGDPLTFYKNLANALRTGTYETASGAGFEISTMNVSRASDGGPITYGNPYN